MVEGGDIYPGCMILSCDTMASLRSQVVSTGQSPLNEVDVAVIRGLERLCLFHVWHLILSEKAALGRLRAIRPVPRYRIHTHLYTLSFEHLHTIL
jgi:hypothetical protein